MFCPSKPHRTSDFAAPRLIPENPFPCRAGAAILSGVREGRMNYHLDEIEQIQSFAKSLPAGHKGLSREDRHIVRDWVRSRLALESTDDAGNPQEQFAYFQTFLGLAKQARWKSLTAYALSEWGRRTKNMYGAIYSSGYEAGHEMANFHVRRQGKEKASFELVARRELGLMPTFFEIKRYRVTVERRKNKYDRMVSLSEAVVVVKIGDKKMLSVSESMDESGTDRGPVNALSKALAKDLGPYQGMIDDVRLVDFKVRITQGGTEAVTRVIIDSEDAQGRRWSTVGVSANIVDASFEALLDAINWKLVRDIGVPA